MVLCSCLPVVYHHSFNSVVKKKISDCLGGNKGFFLRLGYGGRAGNFEMLTVEKPSLIFV